MRSVVIIRVDGGMQIGMGHIMRCSAIANELRGWSCEVLFAVSDEASARAVAVAGEHAVILGGRPDSLGAKDGNALRGLVGDSSATAVLIDSYGVSNAFFSQIRDVGRTVYLDDAYLFSEGFLVRPHRYDVSAVVNYGFGFSESVYKSLYSGFPTELLIGPAYAPVRNEFLQVRAHCGDAVRRVLITSGSTNPNRALERMVEGVLSSMPGVAVDVVVGPLGEFGNGLSRENQVFVHENVKSISSLMKVADLAVAAAGSTLYELCCVGVPTIALPIVENQLANAAGFDRLGLGISCLRLDWSANDVRALVTEIAAATKLRQHFSANSRMAVDGRGAQKIAELMIG